MIAAASNTRRANSRERDMAKAKEEGKDKRGEQHTRVDDNTQKRRAANQNGTHTHTHTQTHTHQTRRSNKRKWNTHTYTHTHTRKDAETHQIGTRRRGGGGWRWDGGERAGWCRAPLGEQIKKTQDELRWVGVELPLENKSRKHRMNFSGS